MICHDLKCIFMHIPKTGGTTVKKLFKGYHEPFAGNTAHLPTVKSKELYADYWDEYFKFTVVRNTWDRLHSCYWFYRTGVDSMNDHVQRAWSDVDFAKFIKEACGGHDDRFYFVREWFGSETEEGRQDKWVYNGDAMTVDCVIHHSELQAGVSRVMKQLGLEPPEEFPTERASNKPSLTDPVLAYTPELAEMVREHYREEIERFGFKGPYDTQEA